MSVDPRTIDYGTDLAWGLFTVTLPFDDGSLRTMQVYDVDPNWAEVTGRLGLAQALARRLVTTHGSLIDDPDYGIDVREWINDDVSIADVQRLARTVEAEMLKDERVQRSQAVAVFVGDKLTLTIKIWDAAGPFKLVLQVSDVGIEKLQVTA